MTAAHESIKWSQLSMTSSNLRDLSSSHSVSITGRAPSSCTQYGRNGLGYECAVAQRPEVNKPDSVCEVGHPAGRDLQCEARFTHPAWTREGQQRRLVEERDNLRRLSFSTDEARELSR